MYTSYYSTNVGKIIIYNENEDLREAKYKVTLKLLWSAFKSTTIYRKLYLFVATIVGLGVEVIALTLYIISTFIITVFSGIFVSDDLSLFMGWLKDIGSASGLLFFTFVVKHYEKDIEKIILENVHELNDEKLLRVR